MPQANAVYLPAKMLQEWDVLTQNCHVCISIMLLVQDCADVVLQHRCVSKYMEHALLMRCSKLMSCRKLMQLN